MTNNEFKHWINGYLSLTNEDIIDGRQVSIIKNHAHLVKEISGLLDIETIHFLTQLENELKQNNCVSFSNFRKYAHDLLTTTSV